MESSRADNSRRSAITALSDGDGTPPEPATHGIRYEDAVTRPTITSVTRSGFSVVDFRPSESSASAWRSQLAAAGLIIWVAVHAIWIGPAWWSSAYGGLVSVAWLFGCIAALAVSWRPGPLRKVALARCDRELGVLRVRSTPSVAAPEHALAFDAIAEVLYSRRRVRAPGSRSGTEVDAAGVFVRLHDNDVWPIVPSTQREDDAYSVAQQLAKSIGVRIKQVGRGWSDATP